MASYPGAKVHRVSRRRLGRGQSPQVAPATLTATAATVTVSVVFSQPVIITGPSGYVTSTAGHLVSETQTSPTTLEIVWSQTQAGATWSIPGGNPNIKTFHGGSNAAAGGTF